MIFMTKLKGVVAIDGTNKDQSKMSSNRLELTFAIAHVLVAGHMSRRRDPIIRDLYLINML